MKRAEYRTEYVLIKAHTNSEWDNCEFAIFKTDDNWLSQLQQREKSIQAFKEDFSFLAQTYHDSPEGFYNSGETCYADGLLNEGETYCFVIPDHEELENLPTPENRLDAHQLVLDNNGNAQFRAYGKYSNEEFNTESFSIQELLNHSGHDTGN